MIAILSDIHGNIEALDSVLEDINKRTEGDCIYLFLGDYVDYGADSVEVLDRLVELSMKSTCHFICGNHDNAVNRNNFSRFSTSHGKQSLEITLKELEGTLEKFQLFQMCTNLFEFFDLSDSSRSAVAYHGSETDVLWGKVGNHNWIPHRDNYQIDLLTSEIHFAGHSHIPGVKFTMNSLETKDIAIINPGSVGQPRNGIPDAQYILADDNLINFKFIKVPYDVDSAASKIIKSGRNSFLATRLYLGI